jgi:hypothetical protein
LGTKFDIKTPELATADEQKNIGAGQKSGWGRQKKVGSKKKEKVMTKKRGTETRLSDKKIWGGGQRSGRRRQKKVESKKKGQGKKREFTRARERAAFCRGGGGGGTLFCFATAFIVE